MRHPLPFSWFLGARQPAGMSDGFENEPAGSNYLCNNFPACGI